MGSDRARAYRSFEPGRARERIDCRHRILRQAPGQVLPAGEQRPKRASQSFDRARCTLNKQAVNGRNMFVYTGGAVANAWGGVRTHLLLERRSRSTQPEEGVDITEPEEDGEAVEDDGSQ